MRTIGLLSFFDEQPAMVGMAIECVKALGVDYLVAADGPYDLFEAGTDHSSGECKAAILDAAVGMDGCSLLSKQWVGNEVEKRNFMLDYAFECVVQGSDDWFLVFDADHFWWRSERDLARHLQSTTCDFAEVSFADAKTADGKPYWYEATLLMRAIPGMCYEGAHWRVELPDGRTNSTLRAGRGPMQAPVLDLREQFFVWHGVHDRDPQRLARQGTYYHERDTNEVER